MAYEDVFGMSSGECAPTSSNTMKTPKALTIAMILATSAIASAYLYSPVDRSAQKTSPSKVKETEDPFADMIEEGDGFLAQRKAEAAEAERKRRHA